MAHEITHMTLGDLHNNFYEIVSASQKSKNTKLDLVVLGNRVYNGAFFFGRVVKMWNYLLELLILQVVDNHEVSHILIRMEQAAKHHFIQAQEHYQRYRDYQDKRYEDLMVGEDSLASTREKITNFNLAFQLLKAPAFRKTILEQISLAHDHVSIYSRKMVLVKNYTKKVIEGLPVANTRDSVAGHLDPAFLVRMTQCQQMIDLEGITNSPIPHVLLKKLSIGEQLDKDEQVQLKKWTNRLNHTSWFLTVRKLHRAMLGVVDRLNHEHWQSRLRRSASVGRLEYGLVKSGCKIFEQSDSIHLKARRKIAETKVISCNGHQMKLENRIGLKGTNSKHDVIYTVAKNSSIIVVMGFNEAELGIRREKMKLLGSLIPVAELQEIDDVGQCAVVERLNDPLDKAKWTSANARLSNQDSHKAQAVSKALSKLLQEELVPEKFSPKHLMFSRDGQLKSIKPVNSANMYEFRGNRIFNFNALVSAAEQASGGNQYVRAYILKNSGLSGHHYAHFYHEMLEKALKGMRVDVATEAGIKGIVDPSVVDRAKDLQQKAKALRDDCYQDILNRFAVKLSDQKLKKSIENQLLNHYKMMEGVGAVSADWKDSIIAKALK